MENSSIWPLNIKFDILLKNLFNSKVSQRIAILLFIAAVIPAMLMTFLSNKKISAIVTNYEHQFLVEESRTYALSVFSNLIFARNRIEDAIKNNVNLNRIKGITVNLASVEYQQFNSVFEVLHDGTVVGHEGRKAIPREALHLLNESKRNKIHIIVLESADGNPSINFLIRSNNKHPNAPIYLVELNENIIWGDKNNFPSDINVCAYQLRKDIKTSLFCSSNNFRDVNATDLSPVNSGNWELFLGGEFVGDPWLFETTRLNPISELHLKEFVGSDAYIKVAILSLLLVGLLSLIQIRKTMVPLEQLISGTKKIAAGDFDPLKVSGTSEFAELAEAFNGMSSHIKNQFETLQSFSILDKEIISNIDIEHIINLVMERMQQLQPNNLFCIAHWEEKTANEAQCHCYIAGHAALTNVRLSISNHELDIIKRYNQGHVTYCALDSDRNHERLMAELGATSIWVLPIFWQGKMVAFLVVGSKNKLDPQHEYKVEFRELASRVGIVISAHEREQQLLFEAQYDHLTGLPNRILLHDRLKVAMEHADRTHNPIWIVFIDLDRFKVINDSLGHSAGDALLKEIGQRLQGEVRETDTVARFGGDEFVVVLADNVSEDMKLNILNRLMRAIASPMQINNQELINTCSIGISVYPDDANNTETLIMHADVAMYRAKELGRNNYQFFTQSLNSKAAERMQMITLLRQALQQNELTLHYQPKIDLITHQIVGVESLIRWHNPVLGHVSPAKFIPIAEDAGLIVSIGDWILQTACKQLAIWQKLGADNLLMSVNISARQFNQNNLIENIKAILMETGTKAEYLELELTESLLMNDSPQLLKTLYAIKSLGMQLSIDDFGTGYSSLSYLNTLPIDTLKIDKAFIDTISLQTKEVPIVNTIISLAKNLRLKVIAEGVETVDQVHYLKAHGCDQIQGYYFSKPLPADGITQLLLSKKTLDLPIVKTTKKRSST